MSELKKVEGSGYSIVHTGALQHLDQVNEHGKLFLKELLNLTGMEVSVNKMLAGAESPFAHKHKNNEELYLFIKGSGQFYVDGEVINVQEGSAIRVSPETARSIRNNSKDDLYFIVIQAAVNSLPTWTGSDGIILEEKVSWA